MKKSELAKISKIDTAAYEKGYADGFEEGRRVGHEEGAKVWAAMQAENEKAAKAKK